MRLLVYLIGLLPVFLFLWIGEKYETEAFVQFDEKVASILFGNDFITLFHYIGDTVTVMIFTLIMVFYFGVKQQNYRATLFIVATVAGGTALNQTLKAYYARPRPVILEQLDSFSYPSGHSMLGVLFLFTAAYLFSRLSASTKASLMYWIVAITLFVLIGLSRIAEGRHYATDVLGGWSLGIAWFTLCVIWYELRDRAFKKNHSL